MKFYSTIAILALSLFSSYATASICSEVQSERLAPEDRMLWQKDVNGDGLSDVFVQGNSCSSGKCKTGLYINCGNRKFISVLKKDYKQDDLQVTSQVSELSSDWSILRAPQKNTYKEEPTADAIDERHDGNDVISAPQVYRWKAVRKAHRELGINSPDDFSGQFIFTGAKYEWFFTESEIQKMIQLVRAGDSQSASLLYFKIVRGDSELPLYKKYQELLSKKETIRDFLKTGMRVSFAKLPPEQFEDRESRRYYARANPAGVDPQTLSRWISEDAGLIKAIVQYSASNISALPEAYRTNKSVAALALARHRRAALYLDESLLQQKETIISWCKTYKISARFIADNLKKDREVAMACIDSRPINYEFFTDFQADREIAKIALSKDGYMLAFAPANIKADRELVELALKNYPEGRKYLRP